MSAPERRLAAARLVLGAVFLFAGINGFLVLVPFEYEGAAAAFMAYLRESGLLYVEKTLEVAAGALLLTDRQVPLALAILAPLTLAIALFHLLLAPNALLLLAGFNIVLLVALALGYRDRFRPSRLEGGRRGA